MLLLIKSLRMINLLDLCLQYLHSSQVTQVSDEIFFGLLLLEGKSVLFESQLVCPRLSLFLNDETVIGIHAPDRNFSAAFQMFHVVHLLNQFIHGICLSLQTSVLFLVGIILLSGLLKLFLQSVFFHGAFL